MRRPSKANGEISKGAASSFTQSAKEMSINGSQHIKKICTKGNKRLPCHPAGGGARGRQPIGHIKSEACKNLSQQSSVFFCCLPQVACHKNILLWFIPAVPVKSCTNMRPTMLPPCLSCAPSGDIFNKIVWACGPKATKRERERGGSHISL